MKTAISNRKSKLLQATSKVENAIQKLRSEITKQGANNFWYDSGKLETSVKILSEKIKNSK